MADPKRVAEKDGAGQSILLRGVLPDGNFFAARATKETRDTPMQWLSFYTYNLCLPTGAEPRNE